METQRGCERFEWNPLFGSVEFFFPLIAHGDGETEACVSELGCSG